METNSNKAISFSELRYKRKLKHITSCPTRCDTESAIQPSPDKVTATSPLMEKNDSFMGVHGSLDHLAHNQIFCTRHIKILHLLHLCVWQRAELPSPRSLIQAVRSSKTHQLLPVEPPSPWATLDFILLLLLSS